jgi:hypothetical protein
VKQEKETEYYANSGTTKNRLTDITEVNHIYLFCFDILNPPPSESCSPPASSFRSSCPSWNSCRVFWLAGCTAAEFKFSSCHAHYMKCSFISDSYTPFLSMSAKNAASSLELPSKSSIAYNNLMLKN